MTTADVAYGSNRVGLTVARPLPIYPPMNGHPRCLPACLGLPVGLELAVGSARPHHRFVNVGLGRTAMLSSRRSQA